MASRFFDWPIAITVLLGAALAAQTPAPARKPQSQAERAADRIRSLQREAEALVSQESQLLVELRKLEIERQIKVEEVASIDRQQKETSHQLEDAAARADALRLIAEADRPDIEARLTRLYRMGRAGYWRLPFDV